MPPSVTRLTRDDPWAYKCRDRYQAPVADNIALSHRKNDYGHCIDFARIQSTTSPRSQTNTEVEDDTPPEFLGEDTIMYREAGALQPEFSILALDGTEERVNPRRDRGLDLVCLRERKALFGRVGRLINRHLPSMGSTYIEKVLNDNEFKTVVLVRNRRVGRSMLVGGITFRLHIARGFLEIVFCVVDDRQQRKGGGTMLMRALCEHVRELTSARRLHALVYADNQAIGFFRKQGFTKRISLPRARWKNCIGHYNGATLMQRTMKFD